MSSDSSPVREMTDLFEKFNNELPETARNGLEEIRELDEQTAGKHTLLLDAKMIFMTNYDTMTPEVREKKYEEIKAQIAEILEMAQKKIEIATNIKNEIDQVSRVFDIEEKKFIENVARAAEAKKKEESGEKEDEVDDKADEQKTPKKRGRKKKNDDPAHTHSNEKRKYCWCRMEKPGEMIACDGPRCKHEWFHFECVGVMTNPHGDWYCGKNCEREGMEEKIRKAEEKKRKEEEAEKKQKHRDEEKGRGTKRKRQP